MSYAVRASPIGPIFGFGTIAMLEAGCRLRRALGLRVLNRVLAVRVVAVLVVDVRVVAVLVVVPIVRRLGLVVGPSALVARLSRLWSHRRRRVPRGAATAVR